MNANAPEAFALPTDNNLIAQYFLLYAASADPTDFEEEIDQEYRQALVRVVLNTGQYSKTKPVIDALKTYVGENFTASDLTATLSGRVTVDHYWIKPLATSHFFSVSISLVFVFGVSALLFRSVFAGLLTVMPVACAVIVVYAMMGGLGIWLEPATSMFAAIAIGLGVDFSIHTIDRLKYYCRELNMAFDDAVVKFYETTGRALFVNWACLFFGFEILLISELPTIFRFGMLTMATLAGGFLLSLVILPALYKVTEPLNARFDTTLHRRRAVPVSVCAAAVLVAFAAARDGAEASPDLPSGLEIATRLAERDDGTQLDGLIRMQLINRNGKIRKRDARFLRRDFEDERKTLIYFEGPTNIKGTSFLTFDYHADQKPDDQWIYLPALSRVRMISSSDRGDYFLGTDFTYEDIKETTSFSLTDYSFKTIGKERRGEKDVYVLECTPINEKVKRELGYSRILAFIDPALWMPVQAEYWDEAGNPLKIVDIDRVERIDDIWTPLRFVAKNHKSGHTTVFDYSEVDYHVDLSRDVFSKRQMEKGF